MISPLQQDRQALVTLLDRARDFALRFRSATDWPTGRSQQPAPDFSLPTSGSGTAAALDTFLQDLTPHLAASPSARFLGYVTGGTTPAALVGDWLAAAVDQSPDDASGFGDDSAAIEVATVNLLLELFGLPREEYHGGFVTGAMMANFTGLATARQWIGHRQGYDVAREGLRYSIPVLTATPHSSALKALAMLGIGSATLVRVATLPGREALDPTDLQRQIAALDGQPFVFVASGGTVNTVDFDDLSLLAELRRKHDFWLHVDAAFGGFAACSPAHTHLLAGWEVADSITIDNHKWLNVPYDSACWYLRREHLPHQVATFQNGNAPYLGDPSTSYNYLNLGPENSRRLRALPAWFTLMAYGRAGYRDIVERGVATARAFAGALEADDRFELLAPVHLNVVAFTLRGARAADIDALAQSLNNGGRYFLTPTTLFGRRGLRAAFVNWQADPGQVPDILAALDAGLDKAPAPANAPN